MTINQNFRRQNNSWLRVGIWLGLLISSPSVVAADTCQIDHAPAQIPLELSPAVEPNAMIMLDSSTSMITTGKRDEAIEAIIGILEDTTHVRFCFSTFNNRDTTIAGRTTDLETGMGAYIHAATDGEICGSDETHITDLVGSANQVLSANFTAAYSHTHTPLAEAYYDITEIFRGETPLFGEPATAEDDDIITYRCQANNVIVLGDGEATYDWDNAGGRAAPLQSLTFVQDDFPDVDLTGRTLPNWDNSDGVYATQFVGDSPDVCTSGGCPSDWRLFKHPYSGANLASETAYNQVTPYPAFSDGWYKKKDWLTNSVWNDIPVGDPKDPPYNKRLLSPLIGGNDPLYCPPTNPLCTSEPHPYIHPYSRVIPDTTATTGIDETRFSPSSQIYIDDLALYSNQRDFRRGGNDAAGQHFDNDTYDHDNDSSTPKIPRFKKQNLITHTIAYDTGLSATQALKDAAHYGGGQFNEATKDVCSLRNALEDSIINLAAGVGSGGGGGASGAYVQSGGTNNQPFFIYTTEYSSLDWSGTVKKIPFEENETKTGIEQKDMLWSAAAQMPADASRTIFTHDYKTTGSDTIDEAYAFVWSELTSNQKQWLGVADDDDTQGGKIVNYLRGSATAEGTDSQDFRVRTRAGSASSPLADSVHSTPVYVNNQNYGFPGNSKDGADQAYEDFVKNKSDAHPTVYVGANDGMLHAFNDATGVEEFAFIPKAVFPKLPQLWRQSYLHRFYVDGKPLAIDAQLGSATKRWKTIYASSLGAGGKALFLLDITTPTAAPGSIYQWEITPDSLDKNNNVMVTGNPAEPVYKDMGYILSELNAIQVKDSSGGVHWYLITGNGVHSPQGKAIVYLIDIDDGSLDHMVVLDPAEPLANGDPKYATIEQGNGISSINPIDLDKDGYTDRIYAGDLKGNVWRLDFDKYPTAIDGDNASNQFESKFNSGTDPKPLFIAQRDDPGDTPDEGELPQPITGGFTVTRGPTLNSVLIFFGTGKLHNIADLFEDEAGQTQSLYAVLDSYTNSDSGTLSSGATSAVSRSDLVQQEISLVDVELEDGEGKISTQTVRTLTSNVVNYGSDKGWFIDLPSYGERVLSKPKTFFDNVVFLTQTPDKQQDPAINGDFCETGSGGWIMVIDQQQGIPGFPLTTDSTTNIAGIETPVGASSNTIFVESSSGMQMINPMKNGEIMVNKTNLKYRNTSWRILQ